MMWTEDEDDLIREISYRGAKAIKKELWYRYGIERTEYAIIRRASRIHCSLRVRTVCPSCGAVGVHINRQTGMCALCTERLHLEEEKAFNEQLQRELDAAEDSEELERVKREREMWRQRNNRICRKHGLPNRRQRKK